MASPETGRLDPEGIAVLTRYLGDNKEERSLRAIEQISAIIQELVDERKITQAEAETAFSDRVLGQFSSIFSKYVVAELAARKFKQSDILNFLIHFQDAYSSEQQVEFAAAVARRMLITINTEGDPSSPDSLREFLTAASAFGVESSHYAEFLVVWKHIQSLNPITILRFILANIQRTGDFVNKLEMAKAEAQAESQSSAEPRRQPSVARSFWLNATNLLRSSSAQKSVEDSIDSISSIGVIPNFIRDLRSFDTEVEAVPILNLVVRQSSSQLNAVLVRRPPPVMNYMLSENLNSLGRIELERLVRLPTFRVFDESLQDAVRERLTKLEEIGNLVASVKSRLLELENRRFGSAAELLRAPLTPLEKSLADKLYTEFRGKFNASFKRWNSAKLLTAWFGVPEIIAIECARIMYHDAYTSESVGKKDTKDEINFLFSQAKLPLTAGKFKTAELGGCLDPTLVERLQAVQSRLHEYGETLSVEDIEAFCWQNKSAGLNSLTVKPSNVGSEVSSE